MQIDIIKVGELDTNCYIVSDGTSKDALVIDPGDDAEKILDTLRERGLEPVYIVNTHGHYDHTGANRELKEKTKALLLIHELDTFGYAMTDSPPPDRYLKDNDRLEVAGLVFTVIHCPGHSPGGISLYCEKEKTVFTGDTLFYGTYGRTDLLYSSQKDMEATLKILLKLPPETKVYPGHGWATTIGREQGLLDEL